MERTIAKTILFKVIVAALPVALILGAAELALRFAGPEYYRFNNNSAEYYSNPRGYHMPVRHEGNRIIYGLNYRTSPEGYRIADDIYSKAGANVSKSNGILVLGDSFTYGRGVKYEDIYTTRLSGMLKKNGYAAAVKNCGRIGAGVEEIAGVYSYETSKKAYPVVVYGFVLNDFGLSNVVRIKGSDFIDNNNGGNSWSAVRDMSKVANLLMYGIEKNRLNNETTKAYLEAYKGENLQKKFEIVSSMNREIGSKGGKMAIMLFPLLYNFKKYPFKEIHEKLASMCAKENIPMLDLLPVFASYKAEELWVNPTDQHPNETAHKLAAESLYKFLVEWQLVKRV